MSMTLYFAKLNLVSDVIFELYDDPKQRKTITYALYEAIKANKTWKKENFFIDAAGEQRSTVIEYSTHILRVDDTYSHIEGWLYKKSKLYYKTLDNTTNTLVQQSTENTEGNRFTLDLKHGYVGYNTSARFGYKEFVEIIYIFLTIFLYLLKCPQSLILSALRAFCFCGKPHISRSIFLYFRYQAWLKSW